MKYITPEKIINTLVQDKPKRLIHKKTNYEQKKYIIVSPVFPTESFPKKIKNLIEIVCSYHDLIGKRKDFLQ